MSGRHQPENGADSAEGLGPDIFDRIAAVMVTTATVEALKCRACSLPAVIEGYCEGHDRLFRYTDHERSGGIAAND